MGTHGGLLVGERGAMQANAIDPRLNGQTNRFGREKYHILTRIFKFLIDALINDEIGSTG